MTDTELRNNFSNNLRCLRTENDLSQTQLAKMFGKKKTTVSSWERGASMPDGIIIYKLAKIFDKPIEYMFENNRYLY